MYLNRPQRLGFLPTWAFWKRPDVQKITGPFAGNITFLWFVALSLFVVKHVPVWLAMLLAAAGPFLCVVVLEKVVRKRLRERALAALTTGTGEGEDTDHVKPA